MQEKALFLGHIFKMFFIIIFWGFLNPLITFLVIVFSLTHCECVCVRTGKNRKPGICLLALTKKKKKKKSNQTFLAAHSQIFFCITVFCVHSCFYILFILIIHASSVKINYAYWSYFCCFLKKYIIYDFFFILDLQFLYVSGIGFPVDFVVMIRKGLTIHISILLYPTKWFLFVSFNEKEKKNFLINCNQPFKKMMNNNAIKQFFHKKIYFNVI